MTASNKLSVILSVKGLSNVHTSDVPAPAWPESPSFGLALGGLGLRNHEPGQKPKVRLGLALAQARAFGV